MNARDRRLVNLDLDAGWDARERFAQNSDGDSFGIRLTKRGLADTEGRIALEAALLCEGCGMPADRCESIGERSLGARLTCCDGCDHDPGREG